MGFNNEHANRIVFDIETAPLPDAADYMDLSEIQAPANYKDPVKIAAYIEEERQKALTKCGLDLDLCRVVAIGWWRECDGEERVLHMGTATNEAAMLAAFWNHAEDGHLVGFNCCKFDLPVLQRRSLYLGVPMPLIVVDTYRHPRFTDLAQQLSYFGAVKMRSLSFYAKRFGIPVQDETTGADIAALVDSGDWAAVESHCRKDVQKTAALASKLGWFRSELVAA